MEAEADVDIHGGEDPTYRLCQVADIQLDYNSRACLVMKVRWGGKRSPVLVYISSPLYFSHPTSPHYKYNT